MIGLASGLLEGQINKSHRTLPLGGFEIPNHLGIFELGRKRENYSVPRMKASWPYFCGTTGRKLKMIGLASELLEGQINRSHRTLPLGGFEIPNHLEIFELERKREGRYKSLGMKCVSNPGDQVYRRRLENPTLGGGKKLCSFLRWRIWDEQNWSPYCRYGDGCLIRPSPA